MAAVEFPQSPFRAEQLADWLELTAVSVANRSASAGELERELNRLSCGNTEQLLGNTFTEIDRREKATGAKAYPFERKNTSIELKDKARNYPAYIFCLALSYHKWNVRKGAPGNPWLLFEELASYSAKNYLGGDVMIFGTSCRQGKQSRQRFRNNINDLAKHLAEGERFREQRTFFSKDSKLDLVAWKGFLDGRPSQVIIFGQCAAGANWAHKLSELDPDVFWDQWMNDGKVSTLIRSVFMPHRLFEDELWKMQARRARLLFDRCRVVALAHDETIGGKIANRLLKCCRTEWKLPV